MWLGGISCQSVWGVIFQWGSTLKVSIELPATSRHRRDMTEKRLKATLSPNQTNKAGSRSGIGLRPRFTFWLTFFQSCMLHLFFSGLLSYLVGVKRRTSRCVTCKRDNSHFVMYLSPLTSGRPRFTFLVNLFFKVVCYLFSSADCFLIW